ncbi:nitrogen regulation protein NR(II) [Geobacillus sp. C56-T2]|uniref:two-component system sensor histidine kinase NtrB n=1 Tax=Geobacillus sp. C56-T2 TaxID=600773 RepID=UPI00119EE1C6|nr:ATP-binding protein [Geobacillus sp. C56-T2]NNV06564.1 GHKL domain-containing protein [Geobacillus sp. MMMUD3]TWG31739.1 signal transduction histidine kinase [Geobacillus sp. C56-T2]
MLQQISDDRHILIDALPFPYFQTDRAFFITDRSISAKTRFPSTKSFFDLIDIHSRPKLQRWTKERKGRALELNLVHGDGSIHLYDVYLVPAAPEAIHLFCIDKDQDLHRVGLLIEKVEKELLHMNYTLMHEKSELQKSLHHLQEQSLRHDQLNTVAKIAASIAHEIRNPLTSVRGFVQLMRPYLDQIGKGSYVDVVLSEIDRANQIIYDLLHLSKPTQGERQAVALAPLMEEVVLFCQSDLLIHRCAITCDTPDEPIVVVANAKQLKQVLLNMIRNSMEAIAEAGRTDGHIRLSLQATERYAQITIRDNGTGIPPDRLERLFQPFFTTKQKGTGLGLSVCKKIIEEHGGDIYVQSELGQGTTFILLLPLASEPI